MHKAFCSVLLALALLLSLCPAALAEEPVTEAEAQPTKETIHIRTAEDLVALSVNCTLDTWSDNKEVLLEEDLSLSDVDFEAIPIFNGEFDGQGHTLYDLNLNAAQSPCGFFLETGLDANIHDLHLSGSVISRGDDTQVGGLVGRNRGLLTNCSFSGQVDALSQVGGIAGTNEASGIITACSASGRVFGLSMAGGVVGENNGTLVACQNQSFVNTVSIDPSLRLDMIDTSSIINFVQSLRTDNAGITSDVGGVAGYSRGFIERCSNSGTVGYLHLGYNVGGVAGRSCGFLNGCTNSGEIYGRKDTGGIVGQAEPFVQAAQAQDLMAGVSYRLYVLNQSINAAIEDARGMNGALTTQFANIYNYTMPIHDSLQNIDIWNPDSWWDVQAVIVDCVNAIVGQVAEIGTGVDTNSNLMLAHLQEISDNANALSNTAVATLSSLDETGETRDILVDSSGDGDPALLTLGKVSSCVNNGTVYGDSNVGGIAGNISLENDQDPEKELFSGGGSRLLQQKVNLYAVVTSSVSRGAVTAKNECAGGIVGKMDFGLTSNCAAYGSVALEDGDYAGGVCGLCYGSIQACCSKCSLSGKRYIGGILGNGYSAKDRDDKSSSVSGCYALTEILGEPHFAGSVSGGGAGSYEGNFYVPAGYAGLNRLSIQGQAEPISFADFAAVEDLPEDCKHFTLRFVADGSIVQELRFEYGASFDRSVFPELPPRDGSYAVWDRTDLNDLRFDTTVTAVYRMDETVLRSAEEREDGRAIVYVDGQFQKGDALTLEHLPFSEDDLAEFRSDWKHTVREQLDSIRSGAPDYSIPVEVSDRLCVSFPDDGLSSHSLRYLTPDGETENHRFYLAGEFGWQRLHPETFGSYYLLEVPGTGAEFIVLSTIQSWWIGLYVAAALLLLLVLIIAVVKLRKLLRARPKRQKQPRGESPVRGRLRRKRKRLIVTALILALLLSGAAAAFRFGSVGPALSAYAALRDFSQRETDLLLEISVHTDERDVEMQNSVHRVLQDGRMILCAEAYGIPLYVSGGRVYLENGRAFSFLGGELTQVSAVDFVLHVFLNEQVSSERTENGAVYEAVLGSEASQRIMKLFLHGDQSGLLSLEQLTARMQTTDGRLTELMLSGEGGTEGGTPVRFQARLTPQDMPERPAIPQAVLDAIGSGTDEDAAVLTEDALRLLAAWVKSESREETSAEISIRADCGSVSLNPHYRYFRTTLDGTDVYSIQSALFKLYFTDSAACTANGSDLSEAQQRVLGAAELFPIAREFCLKGQFSCTGTPERSVYTITVDSESTADIVSRLVPDLDTLDISYADSSLQITVADGALSAITLDCGGSLRIVVRDVETSVRISARFNEDPIGTIPARVQQTLLG